MKINKTKILTAIGILTIIPSSYVGVIYKQNLNITSNDYSEIDKKTNSNIIDLETGEDHSGIIVDTTGDGKGDSVYMWGVNEWGELGHNIGTIGDEGKHNETPIKVEGLPEGEMLDISLGGYRSGVIIDTTGDGKGDSVYMWGDNQYGQLGHKPGTNGDYQTSFNSTPVKVEGLPEGEILDISLGIYHSGVTIDTTGDGKGDSVYMWGANEHGQLGHELGTNGDDQNHFTFNSTPVKVEGLPEGEILDISLGGNHSGVLIDTTGDGKGDEIWKWGEIISGQLGNWEDEGIWFNETPIKVEGLPEGEILDISLGGYHSGVIIDTIGDGKGDSVYMWGLDNYGQLGHEFGLLSIPVKVEGLPEGEILDISLGGYHSGVIIDTTGDGKGDSVYMWGNNSSNQLGHEIGTNGDDYNHNEAPVKVEGLPEGEILDISLGGYHSGVIIDTTGDGKGDSVYMWGSNLFEQLGHEAQTNSGFWEFSNWTPTKVEGIPIFLQDYQLTSIESIKVNSDDSTITFNNELQYFTKNTFSERKVKLNILDKHEKIISVESYLDVDTGQIIINDSGHQFNNDETYYVESIEYNSTVDNFDGYKYIYYPTSNNTFEVDWSSSKIFWWILLLLLIMVSIIFIVTIWIFLSKRKNNEIIE